MENMGDKRSDLVFLIETMVEAKVRIIKKEGFQSKLVSSVRIAKGSILCDLKEFPVVYEPSYQTIQISEKSHLLINNQFAFLNHSCEPNVIVNLDDMVIEVCKEIAADEELSFFYPSCEWKMSQPFDCWCGSEKVMVSLIKVL